MEVKFKGPKGKIVLVGDSEYYKMYITTDRKGKDIYVGDTVFVDTEERHIAEITFDGLTVRLEPEYEAQYFPELVLRGRIYKF